MSDPSKPEEPPVPPVPPAPDAPPAPEAPPTPPAYTTPVPPQPPVAAPPQPYAQPAYGAQPGYAATPAGPPKTLSIVSMITGIVGVVFGGFLPASIAALITGNMAKKREDASARPFWLTGIITGWVGVGFAALWVIGGIIYIIFIVSIFGAAGLSGYDGY